VVGVQQVVVKRLTSLFLIFVFALSNFYVAFWGRVSDDLLDGCAEVFGALGENTDVARETALACILRTQIFYLQVDDFLLPIQKLLLAVSSELSSRHHRILTGTRF
jgi:anthranilate phosphoribosyltransferase